MSKKFKKEQLEATIIKVANVLGMKADISPFQKGSEYIYVDTLSCSVYRGSFKLSAYEDDAPTVIVDGIPVVISHHIASKNEAQTIKETLEKMIGKEKVMKIVKAIKIIFNDGTKVEWTNIRKYTDDKGKLFVAIDNTKEIQCSSKLELQVWYDFKDIKTYTITNKLVEVKEGNTNE